MSVSITLLLSLTLAHLGQTGVSGSRIIHGRRVQDRVYLPYMASVQNDGKHSCGGVLISPDFVLTAAHCNKSNLSVLLGSHNIKSGVRRAVRYTVKQRCKPRSYKNVKTGNDIMLLKLSVKAKSVKTARLPTPAQVIKADASCQVAGWGPQRTGGEMVDDLRVANVSTVDLKLCQQLWLEEPTKFTLPGNVICAGGYETKSGACQGDSGGPLVCGGKVVGVVSFNMRGNCDYPNLPNVYTQLSSFLPWIKSILKKGSCNGDLV